MGFIDSFKPAGPADLQEKHVDVNGVEISSNGSDVENGETQVLHRKLKGRHMQMIAIGGSIGAGLFVGYVLHHKMLR